jgi:hypothetical protein
MRRRLLACPEERPQLDAAELDAEELPLWVRRAVA